MPNNNPFSARNGLVPYEPPLVEEMTDALSSAIWNCLLMFLRSDETKPQSGDFRNMHLRYVWTEFFHLPDSDALRRSNMIELIKSEYKRLSWNHIYDFVEYIYEHEVRSEMKAYFADWLNDALEEGKSGYRFVQGMVVPVARLEEISEIEKAFGNLNHLPRNIVLNLQKAMRLLSSSMRDYPGAIRESVTTVDLLVHYLSGRDGSFDEAIAGLSDLGIHPWIQSTWKAAVQNILRSPSADMPIALTVDDARYWLLGSSVAINYLCEKARIHKRLK